VDATYQVSLGSIALLAENLDYPNAGIKPPIVRNSITTHSSLWGGDQMIVRHTGSLVVGGYIHDTDIKPISPDKAFSMSGILIFHPKV